LRIAIIGSRGFPSTYGGFETFVGRFAPYAVKAGHEVTVYGRGARREHDYDGVRVIHVPGIDSKSVSTASHGISAFLDARRRDFDVALVLNPANGPFLPLLDCPSVVNPDGLEWRRRKWGALARAAFLSGAIGVARWANEVVVDSAAIGRYWRVAFRRQTHFIPYGADVVTKHDEGPIRQLGLEPRSYSLVVARLVPENNVELVLDAFTNLDRDHELVIVGDANYRSPTVNRILDEAGRDPRVRWLGHVADQALLDSLWGFAHVCIHGHSVGGTNPALLQAMGHGAGPLAYRSPFNLEVLGSDRRLFASAHDLSALWRSTFECPHEHRAWKETCRQRVAEAYAWSDVCDRYLDVLARTASKAPRTK
jgi:glycosyltransferase involved in cell wall biosynthesis